MRRLGKKLQKKGYPEPFIMIDQDMLVTEGTLTKKFERLYLCSDFIFSLFFHGLPNMSVNYELGFMTAKSPRKIKNRHRLLLELKEINQKDVPVDLSKDNPYLSSNEGRLYRTMKFKEKADKREPFYDAADVLHKTIVDEIT